MMTRRRRARRRAGRRRPSRRKWACPMSLISAEIKRMAFGPKRVVTADDTHSPAAPYRVVDNEYTLLDASDMVFIDAPGTGFGHLRGADKEKAFYGVDQDAHAFANFIIEFLS